MRNLSKWPAIVPRRLSVVEALTSRPVNNNNNKPADGSYCKFSRRPSCIFSSRRARICFRRIKQVRAWVVGRFVSGYFVFRHLVVVHLVFGHFVSGHFVSRTLRLADTSSRGYFVSRIFRPADISLWGHLSYFPRFSVLLLLVVIFCNYFGEILED